MRCSPLLPVAALLLLDFQVLPAAATTTGGDVDLESGTLVFAPGETVKAVPGGLRGDALDEADEPARVVLSNPRGAGLARAEATLVIHDDPGDVPPAPSLADAAVDEAPGGTHAHVRLTLSAPSGRPVAVAYFAEDDSARADGTAPAYARASALRVLQPGEAEVLLGVAIPDDARDEPVQALRLRTGSVDGATVLDGLVDVHITDEDPPPSLSIGDLTRREDAAIASLPVTLSAVSEHTVTARASTVDVTATSGAACGPGVDFVAVADAPVALPAEQTATSVPVTVCEDATDEPNESANVVLANLGNATAGDLSAQLFLLDDD